MPNGGDLDRPFILLGTFRAQFGHWPTRLRCDAEHHERLREVFRLAFAAGDWERLQQQLTLERVTDAPLRVDPEGLPLPRSWQAVDDEGNHLDYVDTLESDVAVDILPAQEVHAWLGVRRREDW